MRICHVITRLIQGGAQENTLYTAYGQAAKGHEVTVLSGPELTGETGFLNPPRHPGLTYLTIPELVRPLSPVCDLKAYRQLRRFFLEHPFDIVHTHSSKAGILGRLAAAAARRRAPGHPARIVHTIHGLAFDRFQSGLRNAIYIAAEKRAARCSDAIITVCDTMAREALAAGVGAPGLYHTVWSGSDLAAFRKVAADGAARLAARQALGLGPHDILLAAVTRLFPRKGAEEILGALGALPANVRLLLIGDGPLRPELERRAATELPGRAIFQGQAAPEEIPALLAPADLLVHASWREGLARVLVQALAAGLPVVSSTAGGAGEVVVPDCNGLLFPIGDQAALNSALLAAVTVPGKLADLRRGAAATDLSRFTIDAMVESTLKVYDELLA